MTRRRLAVVVLTGALAMAGTVVEAAPPSQSPPPEADVQVALLGPDGCGPFADDLPALVVEEVGEPGDTTPVAAVCLASRGRSMGRATMTVVDAVDREVACSPGEATVDASCAAGEPGELAGSVVQQVTVDPRCSRPPRSAVSSETAFTALVHSPVALHEVMHPQQVICVGLQLRYSPSTFDDQVRAQSDALTWRYAFHLTSL